MRKLDGHRGKVRAVAFSPDGRQLASIAGRETRVSLWDVVSGERTLSPRPLPAGSLPTFAPNGARVTVASSDCLLHWDLASGAFGKKWLRAATTVRQLAYSPDGSMLVASCFAAGIYAASYRVNCFRTAKSGKKIFLRGDPGQPYGLTFSADGRFLAAVSASARV